MSWTRVAELAVAQPRDRVIFVEALLRLGGRLDVPLDQRRAERLAISSASTVLPVPGSPLTSSGDRGVDRDLQVVGRDIVAGAFEAHSAGLYVNVT